MGEQRELQELESCLAKYNDILPTLLEDGHRGTWIAIPYDDMENRTFFKTEADSYQWLEKFRSNSLVYKTVLVREITDTPRVWKV